MSAILLNAIVESIHEATRAETSFPVQGESRESILESVCTQYDQRQNEVVDAFWSTNGNLRIYWLPKNYQWTSEDYENADARNGIY